jgi:hypothetical protein
VGVVAIVGFQAASQSEVKCSGAQPSTTTSIHPVHPPEPPAPLLELALLLELELPSHVPLLALLDVELVPLELVLVMELPPLVTPVEPLVEPVTGPPHAMKNASGSVVRRRKLRLAIGRA